MSGFRVTRMKEDERGTSLVEFALILPILLALVFGIISFGWVFLNYNQVVHAVREGARYGAIQPTDQTGMAQRIELAASPSFSVELVNDQSSFNASGPDAGVIRIYVDFPDHPNNIPFPGNRVRIQAKATIGFIAPVFVANTSDITVTTAGYMRIE